MSARHVEFDVRADESSAFVPSELMADAAVGDTVTVRSAYLDAERTGTVAEIVVDDTRGRFHRVSFD